jgi:hypothetical protein
LPAAMIFFGDRRPTRTIWNWRRDRRESEGIPSVGQTAALALVAAIDDPSRIRRSRDRRIWAWFRGAIGRARSTTSWVSRNAGTDGCGPCCMKPPTSCLRATKASSNSRTGPLRSPSDQRCARRGPLWHPSRDRHARDAAGRNGVRADLGLAIHKDRRPNVAPKRSEALGREQTEARIA